jgi:hypothetical protein
MRQTGHETTQRRRDELTGTPLSSSLGPADTIAFTFMADVDTHAVDARTRHNADVKWNEFSPGAYWQQNYQKLQAPDKEIIHRVSEFFIKAFDSRPVARRALDVGSGTNLYPALLMLPWAKQILLTDFSSGNVSWLRDQLADDASWTWQPFWQELCEAKNYSDIREPRLRLREACRGKPGYAGIEECSVFGLKEHRWDLGTMFFVAESITEDPAEFGTAIKKFVGALTRGAPFAAAFMAGSDGYPVAGTHFPALPIDPDDVRWHFDKCRVTELSVEPLRTTHHVRDGYEGMVVATGFAGGR